MPFDVRKILNDDKEAKAYQKQLEERAAKREKQIQADAKAYEQWKKKYSLEESMRNQHTEYKNMLTQYNQATPEEKKELFNKLVELKKSYEKSAEDIKNITNDFAKDYGATTDYDKWAKDYAKDNPSADNTEQNAQSPDKKEDGVAAYTNANAAMNAMSNLTSSNNAPDKSDVHLANQAKLHNQQAAREAMYAQQEGQIATRDYRGEADKNAVAQAAIKNQQTVQNMGAAAGNAAAALNRQVGESDYNTHMQRQDEARQRARGGMREAYGANQTAERERAGADTVRNEAMQMRMYNNEQAALSAASGRPTQQSETEAPPAQTENNEAENEVPVNNETPAEDDNTKNGWTYNDVQNAVNIIAEGKGELTPDRVNQHMLKRGASDVNTERSRLAPLVDEMNNGNYQEYVDWLTSSEARNGNVSPEENTRRIAERGTTPLNPSIISGVNERR